MLSQTLINHFNQPQVKCPQCGSMRPVRLMLTELHPEAGCMECYDGEEDILNIMHHFN